MPKASLSGYSNGATGERVVYYDGPSAEDQEQYSALMTAEVALADELDDKEVSPSAGISSSTSGSKRGESGTSTGIDLQSPALTTDSPSSKGQPQNQASSTAHSTAGSGQETTSDQASPQDFSADSTAEAEATQQGTKAAPKSRAKRTSS